MHFLDMHHGTLARAGYDLHKRVPTRLIYPAAFHLHRYAIHIDNAGVAARDTGAAFTPDLRVLTQHVGLPQTTKDSDSQARKTTTRPLLLRQPNMGAYQVVAVLSSEKAVLLLHHPDP